VSHTLGTASCDPNYGLSYVWRRFPPPASVAATAATTGASSLNPVPSLTRLAPDETDTEWARLEECAPAPAPTDDAVDVLEPNITYPGPSIALYPHVFVPFVPIELVHAACGVSSSHDSSNSKEENPPSLAVGQFDPRVHCVGLEKESVLMSRVDALCRPYGVYAVSQKRWRQLLRRCLPTEVQSAEVVCACVAD